MTNLLGWFISIRDLGIAHQDIASTRRLRTINVIAVLATLITVGYCVFYAAYDLNLLQAEVAFLLVVSALYPCVLLFTRRSLPGAAMWLLVLVAVVHLATISWLLGPASGALNYLLIVPFVLSLIIREGDVYSVWPIAIAVSGIFAIITLRDQRGSLDFLPESFALALFLANVFGAILLAAGIGLVFRWLIRNAETELQNERSRSDRLLRAILPDPIAERLKADAPGIVAERVPDATALFADIVGFTRRSAETEADIVVSELNRIFGHIDELAESRGVEKIKTIGDAYFAVCGVPQAISNNAERMADFALDLRACAKKWRSPHWPDLEFRIAIHRGPVVAGVIGRTKFAYDVWGDTVNTAARLEERCTPGEILITESVASKLPGRLDYEEIGDIELRDRGKVRVHRLVARAEG